MESEIKQNEINKVPNINDMVCYQHGKLKNIDEELNKISKLLFSIENECITQNIDCMADIIEYNNQLIDGIENKIRKISINFFGE